MQDISNSLKKLKEKLRLLVARVEEEKQKRMRFEREVTRLKEELHKKDMQLQTIQDKYNTLTLTGIIEDKKDKTSTKRKITELVREIDKSISLLSR